MELPPWIHPDGFTARVDDDERVVALGGDGSLRLGLEPSPVANGTAVQRFRLRLSGGGELTRAEGGGDGVTYLAFDANPAAAWEVRFGDFDELTHCNRLVERRVGPADFAAGAGFVGPVLAWETGGRARLVAYEHGSQASDPFLRFVPEPGGRVRLEAVRGHYVAGHDLAEAALVSPWFHALEVEGTLDDLAAAYRGFLLAGQSARVASRAPRVFYNTWNHQERLRHWQGRPYLAEMDERRMLAEVDAAAELGVETFVIDTGWYEKTGDWEVSRERFPRGLDPVRRALEAHGMELGLWFNPVIAGRTSRMFQDNRHLAMTVGGALPEPHPVWETEPAYGMCLCSDYADLFADELVRLHGSTGVTYFKWDAIGQYGCDSPAHGHGSEADTPVQRRAAYGYQLPLRMAAVVDRLAGACPDAVVDFDVTEGGRAFGLGFLAAGKFFLLNNGPYFFNQDQETPPDRAGGRNGNVFFQPGLARTRLCRTATELDRWIPSVLTLVHYLPDDTDLNRHREHAWGGSRDYRAEQVQLDAVASLILGHGGVWGDLLSVTPEGRARFRGWLDLWKAVREDATAAAPIRSGFVGATPEVHEKVHPRSGRGIVCLFSPSAGEFTYATRNRVAATHAVAGDAAVEPNPDGRGGAVIRWRCREPGAAFICFGNG